ncbi:MAG: Ig-like domain-containing protein [Lachnospiraceae bacterium]|nr:Ig-like domain-containing protein [Lachnospiraceae bacterium]
MKGKFIKKLTAYALVAAVAATTAFTAFAAEFSDNFWVSDGVNSNSETQTGTVSSTDTNTSTLNDLRDKIGGITIEPATVEELEVGDTTTLTASIEAADGYTLTDDELAEIYPHIKWRTSNYDIVTVDARLSEGLQYCPINAKAAGEATVTAGLDFDNDGTDDMIASVSVTVTGEPEETEEKTVEDVKEIAWSWANESNLAYVKHTYDLADYVVVTYNDGTTEAASEAGFDITFSVLSSGVSKYITFDGESLTVKKADASIELKASLDGTDYTATTTVKTDAGVPAKSLTVDKKLELNFANGKEYVQDPYSKVTLTVTTAGGSTTDEITWTSSDESVAYVDNVGDLSGNSQTVEIHGESVGKAKITATATSGKKATISVTVKADLISIDNVYVSSESWSGKTETITVERTPAENTDKLTIYLTDETNKKAVKIKNDNVTFANDLTAWNGEVSLTFSAKSKTINTDATATVTVKQSNVQIGDVTNSDATASVSKRTLKTVTKNPGDEATYLATLTNYTTPDTEAEALETVSWTSSKEAVATVNGGTVTVVGTGSTKITASSVYQASNGKYKVAKYSFTVKVTPECEAIVLKSDTAAIVSGGKVTINVKQQLPKKAADTITWYVNGNAVSASNATDKKLTLNYSDLFKYGITEKGAYTVTAQTDKGVYADATLYVVGSLAKKVTATVDGSNKKELKVGGDSAQITSIVTLKDNTEIKEDSNSEDYVKYYTVNKAGVVKVSDDGTITAIGEGKVTVSAVTASGKAGKVTITVK